MRSRGWTWGVSLALGLTSCVGPAPDEAEEGGAPAEGADAAPAALARRAPLPVVFETPALADRARGLGRMTARRPGRPEVIEGVSLARHDVSILVRGGVATTTIDEVFENTTNETLEGKLVFPVPAGASVTDLTLWVDGAPVAAEMVERRRAAQIFHGIVEDTVRPRDPALLEWVAGRELSLKIFPIPARSSRTVRVRYEQRVPELAGQAELRLPLERGAGATRVGRFSVRVHLEGELSGLESPGYATVFHDGAGATDATFEAERFTPSGDFVLRYRVPATNAARLIVEPGAPCAGAECPAAIEGAGVLGARLTAEGGAEPPFAGDRVIVIDTSASHSAGSLETERLLAEVLLSGLAEGQRFAVLACDSACESYPAWGLTAASDPQIDAALAWLAAREARGASDIGGALSAGLERLAGAPDGQVVYVGDGLASAGALSAPNIAAQASDALSRWPADVRLVGTGNNVDAPVLRAIAQALGATFDRLTPGEPAELEAIAAGLERPALRNLRISLPEGMELAVAPPAALRLGDELELHVLGQAEGELSVRASAGSRELSFSLPLAAREGPRGYASRALARQKIELLEASAAGAGEAVELSKEFFVLSRHTSMLVLENDAMFAAFGLERTRRAAETGLLEGLPGTGTGLGYGGLAQGGDGSAALAVPFNLGLGAGHGVASGEHKSSQPKVSLGGAAVSGGAHPDVVRRIVRQQTGRFRQCYMSALQSDPSLSGRVVVRFTIGASGEVSSASSAGSTVTHPQLVQCVVRAFKSMSFPAPEGGAVSVTVPIGLSSEGGVSTGRSALASHPFGLALAQGNDAWIGAGAKGLTSLVEALKKEPTSRKRHASLVRGLLARGQLGDAVSAARSYLALDPDALEAHELLAAALVASGDGRGAGWALESLVELAPTSAASHERAAASLEALGEEARACAHWVSAAELGKGARPRYESLRCRARVRGQREAVLAELSGDRDKALAQLREALERGDAPAYAPPAGGFGEVVATASCEQRSAACPRVVVLDERGGVASELLPGAGGRRGASASAGGSSYRAILVGGSPDALVRVTLAAGGQSRSVVTSRSAGTTALIAYLPALGL